jgi:hypothetical protein
MKSRWGSWPAFPAALLLLSASVLVAQEPSPAIPMRPPDARANSVIKDMHIPTTPGAPFSAKSVATLMETRHGSPMVFGLFSMVARRDRQERRTSGAKALNRDGSVARLKPCPSYQFFPQRIKVPGPPAYRDYNPMSARSPG